MMILVKNGNFILMKHHYQSFITLLLLLMINHQNVFSQAGTLDPMFGVDGLVSTEVAPYDDWGTAIALQSDGKIILAGQSGNGIDVDFSMARYTADGLLDATFGTGGVVITPVGIDDDRCWAINIMSDGKILLCGTANNGSNDDFAMVRYLENGTLDATFGTDGIVLFDFYGDNDYGYGVTTQLDNKIVMVGSATVAYPHREFAIARFNNDGSVDNTFDFDGKVTTDMCDFTSEKATSVIVLSDNKIVVGGNCFGSIGIARYNGDGSLDNSFSTDGHLVTNVGVDQTYPISIATQSDGKIVAAGHEIEDAPYYTKMNFGLVRYNVDGNLDESFGDEGVVITNFDTLTGDVGLALAIQTDGKIIVAGQSYTVCFGIGYFALARYNTNGTLDTTFGIGGLVNTDFGYSHDAAFAVAIQPDGKIIAGGQSGPNDLARRYFGLARYLNDCFYATDKSIIQTSNILTAVATDLAYQWVDCENDYLPVADGTNQTYTATQNGTYAVIFTDGACVDTSECVVVNTVDITSGSTSTAITVFPNPFTETLSLTMNIDGTNNITGEIFLYNNLGELILTAKAINGKAVFNTAELFPGVYVVNCMVGDVSRNLVVVKR